MSILQKLEDDKNVHFEHEKGKAPQVVYKPRKETLGWELRDPDGRLCDEMKKAQRHKYIGRRITNWCWGAFWSVLAGVTIALLLVGLIHSVKWLIS